MSVLLVIDFIYRSIKTKKRFIYQYFNKVVYKCFHGETELQVPGGKSTEVSVLINSSWFTSDLIYM